MSRKVLQKKQAIVQEIVEDVKKVDALIIAEYRGLNVTQLTEIRKELKEQNAKLVVYKNTLFSRALDELGYGEQLEEHLKGPNAYIFSEDVIAGPKILRKYSRRHEELVIKAGIIEGQPVTGKEVLEIGRLPGRDGLLSMVCSVLQGPIRKFAATVQAIADSQSGEQQVEA
ncbi:MAG: 50S ribosomal protein L10 [Erysipelotrichaceae bacterium]|nr:50S ribosomal protein L10 [Erysipelotrichaceae bacterium]